MTDQFEKAANKKHLPHLGATSEQVEASAGRFKHWWLKPSGVAVAAFVLMYLWRFSPFDPGYTERFGHYTWCFFAGVLVCAVLVFYLQQIRPYVSYVKSLHTMCADHEKVDTLMNQVVESGNQKIMDLARFIAERRNSLYWYEVEWFERSTLKEKQ